ncbi:MAG: hypothetical protein WCW44_06300 [archaeon]
MFEIIPSDDWYKWWDKVPREQHQRIIKKMHELKEDKQFRHLKLGSPHFVLEAGQYRILFIEEEKKRILIFVGNHKDYEKWIGMK